MVTTTNLVSYWTLDELSVGAAAVTRNDSHGTNHLTDNNTTASGVGILTLGADFEASSSEYLSITDAAQSGLEITGDISMSFWIKVETLPSTLGTDVGFIDKMKWTATRAGYSLNMDNGNTMQWFVYDSSGNLSRYSVTNFFTAPDVGAWVHVGIAWTAASPSTMLIYKNGASQTVSTSSSAASSINTNSIDFNIARYNSTNYIDGIIDEVGIWSRALTGTDFTDLYNSGAGLAYPFSGGGAVTVFPQPTLLTLGVG